MCIHIHKHINIHICLIYIYFYTYINTHSYIYIYIHIYRHRHIHIHIPTHIHIQLHIHIYMYIYLLSHIVWYIGYIPFYFNYCVTKGQVVPITKSNIDAILPNKSLYITDLTMCIDIRSWLA